MARKTDGVVKVGVNISLTAAEKAAVEARAKRAYTPRVRVVRAAVTAALELDARPWGDMMRQRMPLPDRQQGEKLAVLFVELPEPLYLKCQAKVGADYVADMCRRAVFKFLADPSSTLS